MAIGLVLVRGPSVGQGKCSMLARLLYAARQSISAREYRHNKLGPTLAWFHTMQPSGVATNAYPECKSTCPPRLVRDASATCMSHSAHS